MSDEDDLLALRAEFPSLETCTHLVSHSLGAMPRAAAEGLARFAKLWEERSITAWEEWLPEVDRAAARVGKLLGAPPGTMMMNQNVSTIEAILASCFDFRGERRRVVYDEHNFPSVSYVWKAEERRGAEVVIVPAEPGAPAADVDALCAAIDERTAVVPISHVLFKTAYIQDVAKIIARAHAVGAYVILDTYQSLGTIPVDVVALDVDFVCGGSVKWLCGGPGAAYLYVRKDLIPKFAPRVTGWFGHQKPFDFEMAEQRYADSVWRYLGGTPPVATLFQAMAGHEIVARAGVERIRAKSLRQTQLVLEQVDRAGFRLWSPRGPERGGSVVFDFENSGPAAKELNRRRFFCDHRPGVGIRISPHFYTLDEELVRFFTELEAIRRQT
jgi:kynureninase